MEKKTIATTITGILILVLIICVGATLSAFKVQKEKVEVKSIEIFAKDNTSVTNESGESITELKVISSGLGVRPATGEEDNTTQVPSTINDNIGSEGAYATCFINTTTNWCIKLVSCSLTAGEDENLDNIRIAVLDKKSKAIKGSEVGACLTKRESVQNLEVTIVVWLDADAKKSIASADIKIQLEVVNI